MDTNIEVSVYCQAYNHGKYIAQTLDGFIKQKTSFRFEVIVHDDASTDDTAKVIAEFASRYPEIIKPVYQKENLRSKGVSVAEFVTPMANCTKYFAACEGDDYWTDENKLQIQYDYMEAHANCSMCVHNTKKIAEDGSDLHILVNSNTADTEYSTEEIIKAGGSRLFHTSSFFWRKEFGLPIPADYKIKGIGDINRAIYLSTVGDIHYIGKVLSAYRIGSVYSWTNTIANNRTRLADQYEQLVAGFESMNQVTENKYEEAFNTVIVRYKLKICELTRDFGRITKDPMLLAAYREKSFPQKLKIWVKILLPTSYVPQIPTAWYKLRK